MSSSTTRKPILIRAGHSDLSGVYAKPSSAPRALIVALHGGGNSAAIFDNTIPGEAGFLYLGVGFKKRLKTEELEAIQQKKTLPRHMMRESPSAESAWQRGTFFEKRCFYPDK